MMSQKYMYSTLGGSHSSGPSDHHVDPETYTRGKPGLYTVPKELRFKQEQDDKLEQMIAQNVASIKDATGAQIKALSDEMSKMGTHFQDTIKQMRQAMNQNIRPNADYAPTQGSWTEGGRRDGSDKCFYCFGVGHVMAGCAVKDEHITIGWIKIEDGRLKFGGDGGGFIPRFPDNTSRAQKVEDYWRKKGVSKETAAARQVHLLNSFSPKTHGAYSDAMFETERLDAYDSRDDEMRSAAMQQMEARARMAQNPVNQMMYSQPNVGYTQGAQSFSPMTNFDVVNQFHQGTILNPPMTGNAVPGSSGAAGFDVNHLAQLFGSLGPEDRSRLGQYLTTRQGTKETSSKPGPNF